MPTIVTIAEAAAALAPAVAHADLAVTTQGVNMRAGPDVSYPKVATLGPGVTVDVVGCVDGWQWCDVIVGPNRGFVAAGYLSYRYSNAPVVISQGGPNLGIPLIAFSIGNYWDSYYRGRPWWNERNRWYAHRIAPAPVWHSPPGYAWSHDDRHDNGWHGNNPRGNGWQGNNGRGGDGGLGVAGLLQLLLGAFEDHLREGETKDLVRPIEEFAGGFTSRIAERLGLPFHTIAATDNARDKHRARELFLELERLNQQRDELEIEWGRLQLEQSAWSTHAFVESVATQKLRMTTPRPAEIEVVAP